MPGPSGIEVARTIRRSDPDTRILVLSSIDRPEIIEQALDAGVNGYLLKGLCSRRATNWHSKWCLSDQSFLSPKIQDMPLRLGLGSNAAGSSLTPRQTEILRLVASGRTTKEIARDSRHQPENSRIPSRPADGKNRRPRCNRT
jgi:DNA-binding NarL/FixJ family response regulator